MRHSGLQKEVLALYRNCLRESRKKPDVSLTNTRKHFESFARKEFEKGLNVDRKDFSTIEYLLRRGRRQLEMYSSPGIKDII
ncbi:complex 1 protein-domain-containing protein [Xylogone sp. PMI_703]|nr:complex 1 protein-domain-containing protein [Xylogone sp. PMI_703]